MSYSLARFAPDELAVEAGGALLDEVGGLGAGEAVGGVRGDQADDQAHQQLVAGDVLGEDLAEPADDRLLGQEQLVMLLDPGERRRSPESISTRT